jgi:hypothetical protein
MHMHVTVPPRHITLPKIAATHPPPHHHTEAGISCNQCCQQGPSCCVQSSIKFLECTHPASRFSGTAVSYGLSLHCAEPKQRHAIASTDHVQLRENCAGSQCFKHSSGFITNLLPQSMEPQLPLAVRELFQNFNPLCTPIRSHPG